MIGPRLQITTPLKDWLHLFVFSPMNIRYWIPVLPDLRSRLVSGNINIRPGEETFLCFL